MLDKEKTYEKWSKLGLLEGLNVKGFGEGVQIEEEIEKKNPDYSPIVFPVVRRVLAQTLAGGGWQQSKKQKQKQDRLNKLRQLQGEEPNVVLPDDEFVDGIVSVQPMSLPTGKLFYLNYKYQTPEEKEKQSRIDKIKYILKNNTKKWMTSRFLKKKL